MTKVVFFMNNNRYFGFSAFGHTGYSTKGKDIVCAAVSALLQHTARALTKRSKVTVRKDDGFLEVKVIEPNQTSDLLVEELHESLMDLQSQFPKHLSLEVRINENRNTVVRS